LQIIFCVQIAEVRYAQSKADFVNKLHAALKEASQTRYFHDSHYLETKMYTSLLSDVESQIRILTKSINTTKATLK
jgi:four helix bundle protein